MGNWALGIISFLSFSPDFSFLLSPNFPLSSKIIADTNEKNFWINPFLYADQVSRN